jgi:hypothetical protein
MYKTYWPKLSQMHHTRIGREIHFRLVSSVPITAEDAKRAQEGAGYLVMGYGFWDFQIGLEGEVLHWATWNCLACCD